MSNPPDLLPLLYATDATYGWSQGMRAINHALLTPHDSLANQGPALELGCGAGLFAREYAAMHGEQTVVGTELHPLALGHANAAAPVSALHFARADLHQLPFANATFALIAAFDVYDQQGVQLQTALVESHRVLQPTGLLCLRVSAHPWLESAHDRAFNTAQRCERSGLIAALGQAGFRPLRVTYANMLLALPVIGLRLAQRHVGLPYDPTIYQSPLHNWLIARALQTEALLLRNRDLPFGISLYVLAQKITLNEHTERENVF